MSEWIKHDGSAACPVLDGALRLDVRWDEVQKSYHEHWGEYCQADCVAGWDTITMYRIARVDEPEAKSIRCQHGEWPRECLDCLEAKVVLPEPERKHISDAGFGTPEWDRDVIAMQSESLMEQERELAGIRAERDALQAKVVELTLNLDAYRQVGRERLERDRLLAEANAERLAEFARCRTDTTARALLNACAVDHNDGRMGRNAGR